MPVNVFSDRTTGINFGVYYGSDGEWRSILLYNLSGRSITFDLTNGTAVTSEGETINPSRAIAQNGVYYVPAYPICRYFGLTYSYYSTDYGPCCGSRTAMPSSATPCSSTLRESIMRAGPTATPRTTPPTAATTAGGSEMSLSPVGAAPPRLPPPTATPPWHREIPEDAAPAPVFSLYLGVAASAEGDITATLNALDRGGGTAVVFLPGGPGGPVRRPDPPGRRPGP